MKRWLSLLVLAVLLSLPRAASATMAEVATHDCGSAVVGSVASCTITGVTAGNTIIVLAHFPGGITSLADNQTGDNYSFAPGLVSGIGIAMAPAVHGGSTLITLTCANTLFCSLVAAEFSGTGTLPTFDGSGINTTYATAIAIQTGIKTPASASPELFVGSGFVDAVTTPTALVNTSTGNASPSAFTNQGQTSASGGETIVGAWGVSTSVNPNAFQWTVPSAGTLGMLAGILPGNPSVASLVSVCPAGANGPCLYPCMPVATLLSTTCPAGVTCQGCVTDALHTPVYGAVPVTGGGSTGSRGEVEFNQSLGEWLFW